MLFNVIRMESSKTLDKRDHHFPIIIGRISLIIILLIIAFVTGGCSFLYKQTVFEPSDSWDWQRHYSYVGQSDSWVILPYEYYWMKFDTGEIIIYASPSNKESKCLLFGPAYFIPVFPNIFHFRQTPRWHQLKNFYVDILIESSAVNSSINLSEIKFFSDEEEIIPQIINRDKYSFTSEGDTLPVYNYFSASWDDSAYVRKSDNIDLHLVPYDSAIIVLKRKYTALRFEFAESNRSIDNIMIMFGSIIAGKHDIKIPVLKMEDRNIYYYSPFEFGH